MILNMLLSASHYSLLLIGALFFFCILLCSWPLIGEAIYQNVVLVPADNWSELCTACASVLLFSLKLKYIWNLKQWQKNIKWEMERRAWDTGCDVWVFCNRRGLKREKASSTFTLPWWIALGQLISFVLLSDCGFDKRTHRDLVWSEPSDTSRPKYDGFFSH